LVKKWREEEEEHKEEDDEVMKPVKVAKGMSERK